ncbi:hypothetical protein EON64_15080 [archaeon]|nr:MAG: hypothetical protein EON64_15080 [archaeon]
MDDAYLTGFKPGVPDTPVLVSRDSSFFRVATTSSLDLFRTSMDNTNIACFTYPKEHSILSLDQVDLNTLVSWTETESKKLFKYVGRFFDDNLPIDWERIANEYLNKTPFQCLSYYYNHPHKSSVYNHAEWTAEEEKVLLKLVDKYHKHYWSAVVDELNTTCNTHRTPLDCLSHYQQVLNPDLVNTEVWSLEEEQQLKGLVEQHGTNWQLISSHIPRRSATQCYLQYVKSPAIHTQLQPGHWTEQEERELFLSCIACSAPMNAGDKIAQTERDKLFSGDSSDNIPVLDTAKKGNQFRGLWQDVSSLMTGK